MSPRLLRNVLVALLFASSAAQVHAQPPEPGAVQQVSPSDYMLFEDDLAEGMSIKGGPEVESRRMALAHPDADGNFVRKESSHMVITQRILVGEEVAEGTTPGHVLVWVVILDSPEHAIAFARETKPAAPRPTNGPSPSAIASSLRSSRITGT